MLFRSLAEFDMDLIKSEGYPVTTAVVITNTDDCEAIGEVLSFGDRALDAVSSELMSVRFTVAVDTDWSP